MYETSPWNVNTCTIYAFNFFGKTSTTSIHVHFKQFSENTMFQAVKSSLIWIQRPCLPPVVNSIVSEDMATGISTHVLTQPAQNIPLTTRQKSSNALRLRKYGRHIASGKFEIIFLYEIFCILIQITLTFVPKGLINDKPSLVQMITWHQIGLNQWSPCSATYVSIVRHRLETFMVWYRNHMSDIECME